jgi:hypothetical protein
MGRRDLSIDACQKCMLSSRCKVVSIEYPQVIPVKVSRLPVALVCTCVFQCRYVPSYSGSDHAAVPVSISLMLQRSFYLIQV